MNQAERPAPEARAMHGRRRRGQKVEGDSIGRRRPIMAAVNGHTLLIRAGWTRTPARP